MIAALYARYSSDNQRAESIVAQMRASREYCRRKGYTIVKEYADEAFTGTNDARPAYRQMMKDAAIGLFEVVIFHKVDRNGRNEFDYYYNKRELAKHNVTVEYSGQAFDSTSPEGALMENQLVGLAAYYSRNLSREVKKGLKENVLAGKITGGKPAYGYDIDKNKKYVINEYEAAAVRYMFDRYAAGDSYTEILQEINGRGYRTRRGAEFGKPTLHDILNNRRYIGTCILGKNKPYPDGRRNSHREDHDEMIIVENGCPAIIDKELFEKVQERQRINKRRGASRTAKYNYLLSGLVYCGVCGAAMSGARNRTRRIEVREYYRCCKKANHGYEKCSNRLIHARSLEQFILGKLKQTLLNKLLLKRLVVMIQEKYEAIYVNSQTEVEQLKAEERKCTRALDRLYDIIEDGEIDEFDRARMKKLKDRIMGLRASMKELIENRGDLLPVDEVVKYIKLKFLPLLEAGGVKETKQILENFVKRIDVYVDRIVVCYRVALPVLIRAHHQSYTIEFTREYPRELVS